MFQFLCLLLNMVLAKLNQVFLLLSYNFFFLNLDEGDSYSGAYLFLPDGPGVTLPFDENLFVVANGPIRQYIYIKGIFFNFKD